MTSNVSTDRRRASSAAITALMRPRSVATVGRCKGDWCQVSAGGQAGWVKSGEVWGLSPSLQCR